MRAAWWLTGALQMPACHWMRLRLMSMYASHPLLLGSIGPWSGCLGRQPQAASP